MKKIERVISGCEECRHCNEMVETRGNTFFACICMAANDDEVKTETFLLVDTSRSKILGGYKHIPIPDNCPLETYEKD